MIKLATDNIPWIFSGIGVFIIGLFVCKKTLNNTKNQTIKNNSCGIQAGRDINVEIKKKKKKKSNNR